MINLDLDLGYLSSQYNIASHTLKEYKNMSLVQIMRAEAKRGNPAATKFMLQVTSNPEELAKLFQLVNPKNRYLILMHMNENDLMMVMQFLKPQELVLGLSVFTHEALINLMQLLPPETLATVVLSKMDSNKFLSILPEKYMDEFFTSDKLDRGIFMKALEDVDDEQLQKMMENMTGQSCYDDRDTILENVSSLPEDDFMRAMFSFEPEGKKQVISSMLLEKPDLFEEFSPEAMTHPFKQLQKDDILKSLLVLDTKEMLPMVEKLPQEIMALIATQIDPKVFSKILCAEFGNIIANCGASL